jgi:hypothetical protein
MRSVGAYLPEQNDVTYKEIIVNILKVKEGKAILVAGRGGPWCRLCL